MDDRRPKTVGREDPGGAERHWGEIAAGYDAKIIAIPQTRPDSGRDSLTVLGGTVGRYAILFRRTSAGVDLTSST